MGLITKSSFIRAKHDPSKEVPLHMTYDGKEIEEPKAPTGPQPELKVPLLVK